jgi:hypothetical protein
MFISFNINQKICFVTERDDVKIAHDVAVVSVHVV